MQISQRKCQNDLICHLPHPRAFLCFQSAILQSLTPLLFGLGSFGVVIGCIEFVSFAAIRTIRLLSSSSASSPPSFPQNVLPPATSAQQFRHPSTSVNSPGFAMRFSDFQPVRQSDCPPTSYPGSFLVGRKYPGRCRSRDLLKSSRFLINYLGFLYDNSKKSKL